MKYGRNFNFITNVIEMTKEDTQHNVGKIIKSGERDAVHVAVIPVVAHRNLIAGMNVGYLNGKTTDENPLGIVDPFLKKEVQEGQMFYLFLYPNSITSLRHMWVHPEIPEENAASIPSKEASEAWLRKFVTEADCPPYEVLVAAVKGEDINELKGYEDYDVYCRIEDGYFYFSGLDAHSEIPEEFWVHMENVIGEKIPFQKKVSSFSCSC